MPRHLFIASIFCCLLASLFAGAEAVGELREVPFRFALNRHLGSMHPIGGSFALATLIFAVPIAAIFLRMSSLLAARNLFDAFASFCSTACATLALIFFSIVQLRIAVGGSTAESVATDVAAMAALAELNTVAFYLFGFFLSLTLLTLRPYFLVRSSRTLAVMVSLPLPLYLLLVGQQIANWFGGAGVASAPASIFYFSVLTFIFVAIPIHSFRHRHFFLEATNLRELLDPRYDPGSAPRTDVGFRGGVAFDA